uniref:Uncharacterized protein n=1 Tax=Strigamia maritima TaxID=126957 RepID=T1JBM3_STRMM
MSLVRGHCHRLCYPGTGDKKDASCDLIGTKMADLRFSCLWCHRLKLTEDEIEQRNRSKQIDRLIENEKKQYRRQVKILLLGAGESGKSTFLKQMKIIHGYDFDEEDISEYRTIIYQNVVKGMKVLIDARDKLGIEWQNADNQHYALYVLKFGQNMSLDTKLFLEYVNPVVQLWGDLGIKTAFERRKEFQLSDAVKYFFDNLDRIADRDYIPSNQDILHARKATKGITEFVVSIKDIPFRFVDVGGQRSQRHKWFQCFDSVTSILFLVSSSEFDQVILEDRVTNRLLESLNIFETIVNHRCFSEVSIILFLNKTDLLKQKLAKNDTNLSLYFPEFQGDSHNLASVQTYLLELFDGVRRDRRKALFHHFTTAIDTDNITVVFNAVRDTILHNNLKLLMLQ